jgi:hypothetical protein
MGRSREPPIFARFGRTNDEVKVAGLVGYTPKRLPSRRWSAYTGALECRERGRDGRSIDVPSTARALTDHP